MGGDQSVLDASLSPSPEKICATDPKFCLPHSVQLRVRKKWAFCGDNFKITELNTGDMYFQSYGRQFCDGVKHVLRDKPGNPVVVLKRPQIPFKEKYKLYTDDNFRKKICSFEGSIGYFTVKLSTEFSDVLCKIPRYVVLKGEYKKNKGCIYWGDPKYHGIPVALYRPFSEESVYMDTSDYIVEIAAGMDIVLIVNLCIALDDFKGVL